ncbi:DUF4124 domain-containing protein [Teredinibacter turnerae]|uniref:DUF4124 domain-containing protein n=1 Tax=Teredinibacter turnerae TaxID=2426 RepID=UPI00048AC665|nr:DUF4124 domain-containing protein [Teredinibacter turnerae]
MTPFFFTKYPIVHLYALVSAIFAFSLSANSLADEYYRWKDDAGVVHYGALPPAGVEAEKIKTYGGKKQSSRVTASAEASSSSSSGALPPEEQERRKKVAEAQKEACDAEKSRLELLNKPTRLRMKDESGNVRVLSQDEVMKEIELSKKFISDNC